VKTTLLLAVLCSLPSMAAITSKKVGWEIDQVKYEGVLVADDAAPSARPGLLLVPNWLGVTEANIKQAELVAARGYVVLVADVYGLAARPRTQRRSSTR
jgi:dienelactone hydrolase